MQFLAILVTGLNIGFGRGEVFGGLGLSIKSLSLSKTEHIYKRSQSSIPEVQIAKAEMRGTGCFFLYDKKNFNGLKRKVDWAMQPLLEEITMRSIKFLPKDCADGSEDCPKS